NLSNITNLRLNLFHYKISEIILKKKYDEEFEKELLDFFEEIENTIESERGQQRLILQHCDIVAVYLSSVISRALTQHKLQKFTKTFSVENNNLILRAQNLSKELTIRIYNAVSYAEKVGDILTKAEGYFHLGRM